MRAVEHKAQNRRVLWILLAVLILLYALAVVTVLVKN